MFKIKRVVEAAKLRAMCIRYDYYTRGSNEAYGEMLLKYDFSDEIAEKELEWLAENIKSHSDTEDDVCIIAFKILTEACFEYLEF